VNRQRRPVTLVTGSSRGIGAAVALHLARRGHDVVINYRRQDAAAQRIAQEASAAGARSAVIRADVTDATEVATLFAEATDRLGPVTGVVNGAGATLHVGAFADTPVDIVRRVIDINLLSVLLCCQRAAQLMSTRRGGAGGAIVNVSSAAATLGSPHEYVHYAAAKAGVDAVTVGLAKELAAEGIRVNAVAPGTIRTEIHAAAGDPGRPDRVASRIPLGRPGEPREVAPAVAWLLDEQASYITGAVLRVAGGM
jgi:NAD(P)-dependent dehydrogenase (short-subunit alcohol dehydrogenase family)